MSLLIQSPPFDYLILTTGKTTTLGGRQQGVSVEFASDLVTSRWESAIDFNNQTRELFIYNYSLPSPATTLYTGQVAPDLFEVFDNGSCTGPAAVVVNPLPNLLPLQLVVSTWLFSDYQDGALFSARAIGTHNGAPLASECSLPHQVNWEPAPATPILLEAINLGPTGAKWVAVQGRVHGLHTYVNADCSLDPLPYNYISRQYSAVEDKTYLFQQDVPVGATVTVRAVYHGAESGCSNSVVATDGT